MKKLIFTLFITFSLANISHAGLYIAWNGFGGHCLNDATGTPWVANGGVGLVMLIYTPDNIIDPAFPGNGVSGNDIVLDYQYVDEIYTGNPYGAGYSYIYGNPDGSTPYMPGYVYVRVFEAGTIYGSIPIGAAYHNGPLYATVNNPGVPTPPTDVSGGDAGAGPGPYGTWPLNFQVVPEPATFAIFALGGILVAVKRKISNK